MDASDWGKSVDILKNKLDVALCQGRYVVAPCSSPGWVLGVFCGYTFDHWPCVHLDIDLQPDLL